MNLLTASIVGYAQSFVGVHERKHNAGIEIEAWQVRVGAPPGSPWCACFAWCMVDDACQHLGIENPLPRTASVHKLWNRSPEACKMYEPVPGAIFCHDSGGGKGHCGIVEAIHVGTPGYLVCVEGNTDLSGDREGDGVYRRTRPLGYANLGYLDPSAALDYPIR